MQPELVEKWATALESGKYKQARGALRKGDGFCCLGVLLDIVKGRESWIPRKCESGAFAAFDGETCLLSHEFCKEVELKFSYVNSLANRNDRPVDFKELAAEIRSDLGGSNANG